MAETLTAVIPVRAGSQRVPNKNIRPFGDTTLLDLKLEVLAGVEGLDRVVVNTDCDQCEAIARRTAFACTAERPNSPRPKSPTTATGATWPKSPKPTS